MATMDQIVDLFDEFGKDLTKDLLDSFKAKGHADAEGQSSLTPRFQVLYGQNNVLTFRLYINDYTDFIDKGTRPARRRISIADRERKIRGLMSWAVRRNINAETWYKKKLKNKKTKLTHEQMRRSLANAISHSVAKKGIKGSGFYSSVVNDGRIQKLKDDLEGLLGRDIDLDLQ